MTGLAEYDRFVEAMVALNIPRDKAEAAARKELRVDPSARNEREANVLEKKEQAEIVSRFRVCRFKVYNLSQARASKQTPGLADLFCVHLELPFTFWWESKRQVGGKHSTDQIEFAAHMLRCGVHYGTGDRYDAERWLVEKEFAEMDRGSLFPRRT